MVDLNQIKIAFFDSEEKYICDIITQCKELSIDLCLVSLNGNTANTLEQLEWAKETYGVDLEVCSAPSIELALAVMETMAKLRGYTADEVLFAVSDTETVNLAEQKGFLTIKDLAEDFVITEENRDKIGYRAYITDDFVIPEIFYDAEDRVWYKVTAIGEKAFKSLTNLKSVVVPDTVTYIEREAFCRCNLEAVVVGNSVTEIGERAFFGCTSLASINIPDSVTSIGMMVFGDCISLTSLVIPDSIASISNYAFMSCSQLSSVDIPNSVTSIGAYAFWGCTSLTIEIPGSVAAIGPNALWNVPKVIYNGSAEDKYNSNWGAFSLNKT